MKKIREGEEGEKLFSQEYMVIKKNKVKNVSID